MAASPLFFAGPVALYAMGQVAGNSSAGDLILRAGGGGGKAVGAVRLSSDVGMVVGPALAGVIADVAGVEAPFWVLGTLSLACALAVVLISVRR
jgi:MFS family permease